MQILYLKDHLITMEDINQFIMSHPLLVGSFVFVLILFIFSELRRGNLGYKNISSMQAVQVSNHEEAIFLDVREPGEYNTGHLVDSVHIPLGSLMDKLNQLEKYKEKSLIIYCRSGNRSAQACEILKKQGFTQLYNLQGGIIAWQADNMPVVKN